MAADLPRSLKDPVEQRRRRQMLTEPHIAPLADYVRRLRTRPGAIVPDFDPCDGGILAKILFLFEKPGPATDPDHGGSGFISRNNDDPTAEATFRFMEEAGIPRGVTLTWNAIPWWNGTRRLTGEERSAGLKELEALRRLVPGLTTVVLVGRTAGAALPFLQGLRIVASDHPSPLVRARYPERWRCIPSVWRGATGG
jgi:hypothetical protein